MGLIATNQEHYDESIDWNRQALVTSQANGAGGATAVISEVWARATSSLETMTTLSALFQRADEEPENRFAERASRLENRHR